METILLNRTKSIKGNDSPKEVKKKKNSYGSVSPFYSNLSLKEMVEKKQSSVSNKNNSNKLNDFLNEMDKAMEEVVLNDEISNSNEEDKGNKENKENKENKSSYEISFNGTFKEKDDEDENKQKEHHHHHHNEHHHHHHHHSHNSKEEKHE